MWRDGRANREARKGCRFRWEDQPEHGELENRVSKHQVGAEQAVDFSGGLLPSLCEDFGEGR